MNKFSVIIILLALTACEPAPFNAEKYTSVFNTCIAGFRAADASDVRYCDWTARHAAERKDK